MANLTDWQSYVSSSRFDPTATRSTAKLWEHQGAMLSFILSMPYSLIYAGMGTGKTLVGLRLMEYGTDCASSSALRG